MSDMNCRLPWIAVLVVGGTAWGQDAPAPDSPPAEVVILEGQITDQVGVGQADVEVTVYHKAADGSKGELIAEAVTDKLGDFKIVAPKKIVGEVVVTLSKTQFADSVHVVELVEDEVAFLGESLRGNLAVSGRVVNALGKSPVAGAKVLLKSPAAELEGVTDKDGKFRITGVSPGGMEIIVEAERFGRERQNVRQIESFQEKEIILKPDRIVRVVVFDESINPIGGVHVDCYDQPRTDLRQGVTDAQGKVTFHGIHFDAANLGVRLTHADYVSGATFDRPIATPPDARESSHELTMVRAGAVRGKVLSVSGSPVQGARIFFGEQYSDGAPKDFSSHAGEYEIRGIRPGRAALTIHASGYAPEMKEVEVPAGGEGTLDFTLSAGLVLEGVVKDDKGSSVADAELISTAWRGQSSLGLRTMSDANGKFRFDNAPVDAFEVLVHVRGRPGHSQSIQAGKGVVEITLPPGGGEPRIGVLPVGESMPDLTLKTLDGKTITTADLRGKTVLLDFWATWCLPCVEEQKHFIALLERHGGRKDFLILGISRDSDVAAVRDYLARFPKIQWDQVVGNPAGVRQACDAFGVKALPEVFLVGPDGKVVAHKLRGEAIEKAVDDALKGKSPP